MKKILSFVLALVILTCSVFALSSCRRKVDISGTYSNVFIKTCVTFQGNTFKFYSSENKYIDVTGTYELYYEEDGELDSIRFTLDDEYDVDIMHFPVSDRYVYDIEYDKDKGHPFITIGDTIFD